MDTSKKQVRFFLPSSTSSYVMIRFEGTIRASERFQSLSAFASIYGIGPTNARRLYDLGLRTIEDLERYYDVPSGCTIESLQADSVQFTPNGVKIPKSKTSPPDMSIKIALALREELEVPIPREEVEEMHRFVVKELREIQPGCVSTIVGGLVCILFQYHTI